MNSMAQMAQPSATKGANVDTRNPLASAQPTVLRVIRRRRRPVPVTWDTRLLQAGCVFSVLAVLITAAAMISPTFYNWLPLPPLPGLR
jgi:hypothetical protein